MRSHNNCERALYNQSVIFVGDITRNTFGRAAGRLKIPPRRPRQRVVRIALDAQCALYRQ